MKGVLTLIPTPIDDESPLEALAFEALGQAFEKGSVIAVEEAKTCRRRWIRWGLAKEAIVGFVLYNEHTSLEEAPKLLEELRNGRNVFLMSDCGLPAFCDPGRLLVELCHQNKIKVTATPFSNSVALALALSGFPHERFIFEGFIPARGVDRTKALKRILKQ
jgi:16S rRNA (cytidine1402-2'-O)-methyltransferase